MTEYHNERNHPMRVLAIASFSLSLSGCAAWWGDGGRAWADAQISQRDAPLITYNQTEIFGAPGDAGNVTVDEAHP
jgi:hypothetical protein